MNTLKICKQCLEPKASREFYKMKGMLDGLDSRCSECKKKYERDKYLDKKILGTLIRL
jgi:hypothetical protein